MCLCDQFYRKDQTEPGGGGLGVCELKFSTYRVRLEPWGHFSVWVWVHLSVWVWWLLSVRVLGHLTVLV